jgi:hypothetical protein
MSTRAQVLLLAAVPVGMDKIAGINQTALEGIQRGVRKLHEAAHEIATAPVRGAEPTELAVSVDGECCCFERLADAPCVRTTPS